MAAESAERNLAKMFRASESCSVCLDAVSDSGERSIAKLKCGHHFHLDCIGSAFNAKGAMQCPNCRHVENGQWLYANGSRLNDDFPFEEISYEDEYEVYQTTVSPFLPHRADVLAIDHYEYCPYGHLGLSSGGSTIEPLQFSLFRDMDASASRIRSNDLVVNVSYNHSGDSSPPVGPYAGAQARQSQGIEESQLRQSVTSVGSTRPLDPSGASNSGSLGSLFGDGGDLHNSGRSGWALHRDHYSHYPFGGQSLTETSSVMDQTRFSPSMERISPLLDLLSRDRSAFHSDTGSGSGSGAHDLSNSWLANEQRINNQFLGLSPQHGHNDSYMEGLNGQGPCPYRRFGHGQVGNSQSQSQYSPFRSAQVGNSRRSRQNGLATPSMSGGGRTEVNLLGSLGESSNRRAGQSCPDLSLSLGPEPQPQVYSLESNGLGYHGGQGFVPWGWRDNHPSAPSSAPWTPGQLWHPPTRPSPGLPSSRFSYPDFVEGHGSSQHSLPSPAEVDLAIFGADPTGIAGPIRSRMPSPTPYNMPLGSPPPPLRWCA